MPRFKCPENWSVDQRLAAVLPPLSPNGCRIWTRGQSGRPQIRVKSVTYLVARLVLEKKLGRTLRKGMYACHSCNNPKCVSEGHLYEGTPKQNTADMIAAGTRHTPGLKGVEHGCAVLTEAQVRAIRKLEGYQNPVRVGLKFGIGRSQVLRIWNRESWKHI